MKFKKWSPLVAVLWFVLFQSPVSLHGQCAIDSSYTTAGIYPTPLPDATASAPYDVDVTFVMLTDTLGLTIYNYRISTIVGLPIGVSWQCSNYQNGCNYNPATSLYGCVKLSGTPLVPGNFVMTVTVIADVQLVGQQVINFDVPLTVLPGTVSNPGFSMVNSVGCSPLTVDFINNNPGQASYQWDFGNGLQSNLENPPSQIYSTPGTYVVTQTVTPNVTPAWYLTQINVSSIPNNYGGILDDPDLYFLLYNPQGTLVYDSRPALNGVFPPVTWNLPNLQLANGNYTIHVWDEDGGLFGADDDLGAATFAGNGPSGTATGTVSGATGILTVNYTIFQTPVVPLVATDTIIVYASPVVPVISPAGPLVYCEGNAVALSVPSTSNQLQWYNNGSVMVGEIGDTLIPSSSGSYTVMTISPAGCTALSQPVSVTVNPTPVKPTFFVNGNVFTTGVTGLNLQWYFNGNPVPGATGSSYSATQNGTYQLCGTDANGCTNCSDPLSYVGVGLNELNQANMQLYPNPSHGRFTLVVPGNPGQKLQLTITNTIGELIDSRDISGSNVYVYPDELIPGVYLISVSGSHEIYHTRLVVN